MIQRSECLCNGKIIGIESIYTVIDGKQINIPEKLAELREKSRKGELFCPCGCGNNLILVAGDKNLRSQHFRMKTSNVNNCVAVSEGTISMYSKIVLKCWLDDKLQNSDIEFRIPIRFVGNTDRRYEYTFLSRNNSVGLCYSKNRINLLDEKFDILNENGKDIDLIYVVDIENRGTNGQYPENNIKMQSRQEYCLFLEVNGSDYNSAKLIASFFTKNIDGLWQEIEITSGNLSEYSINSSNNMIYKGRTLKELKRIAEMAFEEEYIREKKRRSEERKREEDEKLRIQKERAEIRKILAETPKADLINTKKTSDKRSDYMIKKEMPIDWEFLNSNIDQQEKIVKDKANRRWVRCICCGKIMQDYEFAMYGGENAINLGTCKKCQAENKQPQYVVKKEVQELVCPKCGGKLIERKGKFGPFYGCSSYPKCRYTKDIE